MCHKRSSKLERAVTHGAHLKTLMSVRVISSLVAGYTKCSLEFYLKSIGIGYLIEFYLELFRNTCSKTSSPCNGIKFAFYGMYISRI